MTPETTCATCGMPITEAVLGGKCPACLKRVALAEEKQPDDTVTVSQSSHVADSPVPPRTFGNLDDYEIIAPIAHGGMGVVYRARQRRLKREVALKMVLSGSYANAEELRRFRVEAEAVARLDHPNIVPLFEAGEQDGRPWFSMRLIEGGTLADKLLDAPDGKLEPRTAAALVAKIARAVHHAHQRGLLHRDLKPANILLDTEGEPHVSDFGLAKPVENAGHTATGAVLGTPGYMAPEQAAGKVGELTTVVDVFALGAILYHALVGKAPFGGSNSLEVILDVIKCEPARPSTTGARVDRDIETVCLRCLEKKPAARYGSAEALAEDLERWLRGEPVSARRTGAFERTLKWARRRPAIAALGAAALFSAMGAVGALYYAAQSARREIANVSTARAGEREQLRQALLERARAGRLAQTAGWKTEGLAQIAQAAAIRQGADLLDESIAHLAGFDIERATGAAQQAGNTFTKPQRGFRITAAVSYHLKPDTKELLIMDDLKQAETCRIPLPELRTPVNLMWSNSYAEKVAALWWRSHGKDRSDHLQLWKWDGGRLVDDILLPQGHHSISLWNSDVLAYGTDSGSIGVINVRKKTHHWMGSYTSHVYDLSLSEDGMLLLSRTGDGHGTLWMTGTRQALVQVPEIGTIRLGIHRDESLYPYERPEERWGWIRRPEVLRFTENPSGTADTVNALAFSPDARLLAVAGSREVTLLDAHTLARVAAVRIPRPARAVFFSADGRHIIIADNNTTLRSALSRDGRTLQPGPALSCTPKDTRGFIDVMHLSTDRRWLTAHYSGESHVLDLQVPPDGWQRMMAKEASVPMTGAGSFLMVPSLQVMQGGKVIATLPHPEKEKLNPETSAAFSPDGHYLAVMGAGRLVVYETSGWRQRLEVEAESTADPVTGALAWSADGSVLAHSWHRRVIRLLRVKDGARIADLRSPVERRVVCLRFSPDNQTLAAVREGGSVELWDAAALKKALAESGQALEWPAPCAAASPPEKWSENFDPVPLPSALEKR